MVHDGSTDGAERALRADELLDPAAYPHPVAHVEVLQTNTSLIALTGEYAYKIKKPVSFAFLDASTLSHRRFLCEEELRLNVRLAPELYLDVLPIVRTASGLRVGGSGETLEYAVRMRQFDRSQELAALLGLGEAGAAEIAALALAIARFHASAPRRVDAAGFAGTEGMRAAVLGTIATLLAHADHGIDAPGLGALIDWTHDALRRSMPRFREREAGGFIRECHGDLHSRNIVRWRGRLTPFDCLEFDAALRWIDVMSDVAFLVMDLHGRNRTDLAAIFLSEYLTQTGDYGGIALLPFYAVHRALVRAMVDALAAEAEPGRRANADSRAAARVLAADGFMRPPKPILIAMHGPSGSGKSWLSERLVGPVGAVRIRSDVERHRLYGASADRHAGRADARTYARLRECATACLEGSMPTIIDATCLRRADRDRLRDLAASMRVPLLFLSCTAEHATLARRVGQRRLEGADASDANLRVLVAQLAGMEPFATEERAQLVEISTSDPQALAKALAAVSSRRSLEQAPAR
ncbi:MAG: AAA family ATPase [Steroidobacteraceae bacterium]|nr:AAA family ATPase [Steroidobacteraceae bacterium]